ncbi:hypothetical protein Ahy_A09g042994 [Arachis hypogaea]|uniref:Aminotransferase-like plant mobile domain-containing protein n=1 Tax=Arachis hypogaea TaxID=3818 RepID=A0A445BH95_ARAHY|nr:hypothetical protein Ahy_A09g042994 [Arachis hypogaea]
MWYLETHTFYLPVSECVITLEDVAHIFGFLTDGLLVTGVTMSNYEILEAECIHQFGIALRKADYRESFIKLTWLRDLKERLQLNDQLSIERYVKCHIMLLFGTILFGDTSGTTCIINFCRCSTTLLRSRRLLVGVLHAWCTCTERYVRLLVLTVKRSMVY